MFIPMNVFLSYYASNAKTKSAVNHVVNNILKEDKELNNMEVVYIMFKPYVNDTTLQTTCQQNHSQEMDCSNIKALRKNNLLIEETKTMLSHKIGYFKQLWVMLFVDKSTYTVLNDTVWKPLNINTLILKKIEPLFDKLSAKEVWYLKALLDNNSWIYNINFSPIRDGKDKLFSNLRKISAKAQKLNKWNVDEVQKEATNWLQYYVYLVYKAFTLKE